MPQFTPTIEGPDVRSAEFIRRGVDTSKATVTALGAVEQGLSMAVEQQDRNIKQTFTKEQEKISQQETIFREKQAELTSDLLSAKDKDKINSVHSDLVKLEQGEVSGALSRQNADIRRKTILRQSIQESPWLTSELSALQSAYKTTGVVTDSPEKKALDSLREEASLAGRDVATQMDITSFVAEKDYTIAKKEQALASGTLKFPQFRNAFNSQLELERTNMFNDIQKAVQADPKSIDGTDWGGFISQTEARFRRLYQQEEAKAASRGTILSDTERSRIEKDIDNAMSGIRSFADSKDKLAYLSRQEKAIKLNGMDILSKSNPFFAFLVSTGMGDLSQKYMFEVLPSARKEMAKHRNLDRIELAAENGDADSILFMQSLDFNSQVEKLMHNKLKSGFDGTEGDLQKSTVRFNAGKWLSMPTEATERNPEYEDTLNSSVERLAEPEAPVQELQWFTRPEVKRNMTPSRIKTLNNKLDLMEASLTGEQRNREEGIDTGVTRGRGLPDVVKPGRSITFDPVKGFSYKGEVRAARTPESTELKNLNLLYKLRKQYGSLEGSPSDWADALLKQPEKPAVEEPTPQEPVATKLEDGVYDLGDRIISVRDGKIEEIE